MTVRLQDYGDEYQTVTQSQAYTEVNHGPMAAISEPNQLIVTSATHG